MGKTDGLAGAGRHISTRIVEAALVAAIVGVTGFMAAPLVGSQPWFAHGVDAAPKVKAALTASPSAVQAGSRVHVAGVGMNSSSGGWLKVESPTALTWYSVFVAADGTFAIDVALDNVGKTTLGVYQTVGNRTVLMSSDTVMVQ